MKRLGLLSVMVLGLAACEHSRVAEKPGAEAAENKWPACPNLSWTERLKIRFQSDHDMIGHYTRAYCVTIEEARRRMAIQNETFGPDSISGVASAVEANEAATFAGLWIEHTPGYRVVVAFTRDAEATLAKYTRRSLFHAVNRPGPTEAQLMAEQSRLAGEFSAAGVEFASIAAEIKRGALVIAVPGAAPDLRPGSTYRGIYIPEFAEIIEYSPMPIPVAVGAHVRAD